MYKEKLKSLTIVHWALVAPVVGMGAFVLYLNSTSPVGEAEDIAVFQYLPGGSLIFLWPSSLFIYQRLVRAIPENLSLDQKLLRFQSAHLVRMAAIEVVGMLAAVVSFVTTTNENLLIIAIVFGLFFSNQPTKQRIVQDLKLNQGEQVELDS